MSDLTVPASAKSALERAIAVLLRLESVLTVPVFLIAWLVSAMWVACQAGYKVARLDTPQKVEMLRRLGRALVGGSER